MAEVCSTCKFGPGHLVNTSKKNVCEAGYPHPSGSVEAYLRRIKVDGTCPCVNDPLRAKVFAAMEGDHK